MRGSVFSFEVSLPINQVFVVFLDQLCVQKIQSKRWETVKSSMKR